MNDFTIPQDYIPNLLVCYATFKENIQIFYGFLTAAAQLEVKVVKRNPPSHTDEKHLSESEAAPFIHVIVRHRAWRKHFQSVT